LSRPFEVRGVEVGMRYDNSFQPPFPVDEINSILVQEGNQVPQNVTVLRLQEDGALADAELFASCRAVAQTGRELGWRQWCRGDVVDAKIVLVGFEFVLLGVLRGI